jgi:hypothetical protein
MRVQITCWAVWNAVADAPSGTSGRYHNVTMSDIRAAFAAKFDGGYWIVYASFRMWISLREEVGQDSAAFFVKEIKILQRAKNSVTKPR